MKLITNRYELLIVFFSVVGIVFGLINYISSTNSGLSIQYLQLIIFFVFISLYTLRLKITIYFTYVFAIFYMLSGSMLFGVLLIFIISQYVPRWNQLTQITDRRKVNIYFSSFELLQRYVTFFMFFVILNFAIQFFYTQNLASIFTIPSILMTISSVALLITVYMSLHPVVESLYFYVISIVAQIGLILYVVNFDFNAAMFYLAPYLVMLLVLTVYFLLNKKS